MSAVCPNRHRSANNDYCDQCGAPIAREPAASLTTAILPAVEEVDTSTTAVSEPCPGCGAPRLGDDRYCEACGQDFLAPPKASAVWEAVVQADPEQFARLAAPGLTFPVEFSERRFALHGDRVRIGCSRGRGGDIVPEIDLAGPGEDPGVSRLHAVLERCEDGTFAVRDLGSTNGTLINDDPRPISSDAAVAVGDGDVIRIGAWTAITLRSC